MKLPTWQISCSTIWMSSSTLIGSRLCWPVDFAFDSYFCMFPYKRLLVAAALSRLTREVDGVYAADAETEGKASVGMIASIRKSDGRYTQEDATHKCLTQ